LFRAHKCDRGDPDGAVAGHGWGRLGGRVGMGWGKWRGQGGRGVGGFRGRVGRWVGEFGHTCVYFVGFPSLGFNVLVFVGGGGWWEMGV
jgi:hypothetical protein